MVWAYPASRLSYSYRVIKPWPCLGVSAGQGLSSVAWVCAVPGAGLIGAEFMSLWVRAGGGLLEGGGGCGVGAAEAGSWIPCGCQAANGATWGPSTHKGPETRGCNGVRRLLICAFPTHEQTSPAAACEKRNNKAARLLSGVRAASCCLPGGGCGGLIYQPIAMRSGGNWGLQHGCL